MFLSWVEPGDEFVNEEPVEYAYEDQAFDNSENLAGKMTTPRNHFYLCFASCRGIVTVDVLELGLSRGAIATRKLEGVMWDKEHEGLYWFGPLR